MRELGISTREIRATGGGSRSPVWRQILADVFNSEVVCLTNEEGAAFGAALQAMWAYKRHVGQAASIEQLCDRYVTLDESTRTRPSATRIETYSQLQALHNHVVSALGDAFSEHRRLIAT
jgi:xylulokinase